jgi:adenylate cyclase
MSGQLGFLLNRLNKNPLYYVAILFIFLLAMVLFIIDVIHPLDLDTGFYDLCMNNRVGNQQETQNDRIAAIDINDKTIETLAEKLDTRDAFTEALDVLAQSGSTVVIDFLFRYRRQNDAAFASAIKRVKNPVIAAIAVDKKIIDRNSQYKQLTEPERQMLQRHIWHIEVLQKGDIPRAGTFLLPFSALGAVSAQIAHINIDPDKDGVYRRIPLLYEWESGYIPSLSLAAAVLSMRIPVENIRLKAGAYLELRQSSENEAIRIPIDKQGRMLVPYNTNWKDNESIPFHKIVDAKNNDDLKKEVDNELSDNHIAFIAEISTTGQKDFGATSFERLYPLSGAHIAVLSGILDGYNDRAFIGRVSLLYKITVLLLFLIIAFLCSKIRKDPMFLLGCFVTLLVFSGVTVLRWHYAAIAPWCVLPVTMFIFLLAADYIIVRLVGRHQEQMLLRNALSRYIPRALAERIIKERKTELIPAYKELTILFADIADFTKWSSKKSPEQVHAFLSDYLESMAGILFDHGGTVDKYMGDGIMAFFGDPLEMPDHCERCLRAAIAMQEKIRILAEKWKPLADIDLKVRIGVNTGKVIVGNLGSKTRIEYTVIGAAVNLAQRMESNALPGAILVTAPVWEKVNNKFAFSEKQYVEVKGYMESVEAYFLRNYLPSFS